MSGHRRCRARRGLTGGSGPRAAHRAIYIRDFGALMVDSGAGMLGVSILGGEEVMTAQAVLDYAIDVAQIVLPRYLESLP